MRITLDLSPEALARMRQIARQRGETPGRVASDLILRSSDPAVRNGVPVFVPNPRFDPERPAPDLRLVNRLRDEDP